MRYLALDIGKRRTGVAFLDEETGIPLPLDTLHHTSETELVTQVAAVSRSRDIAKIIVGLPLLPSGKEGEQAHYVREVADRLIHEGFKVTFLDERYTTKQSMLSPIEARISSKNTDGDAAAACAILSIFASY